MNFGVKWWVYVGNFGKQNWRWHLACLCGVFVVCVWDVCEVCVCVCWCWCVYVGVGVSRWPLSSLPVCTLKTPTVCTFITSPCGKAPCSHVSPHAGVMPVHTATFWMYTRRAFLNPDAGFPRFSACRTHTPHTNKHTPREQRHAQHNTETEMESDRDRERDRERQRKKTRQDERERRKDEKCKDHTSFYRKLATETVYLQPEQRHEHWGQAWDKPHQQVQWQEHEHAQHAQRLSMNASAQFLSHLLMFGHMHFVAQVFMSVICHPCTWAFLLEFTFLPFYFNLSFTVLSFFFPLLHFEQHTELNNLIAMQNLRTSENRESNDAYDVTDSLTNYEPNYMPSASSTTPRVPSPTLPRHQTRTWMTRHSASCSPRHTEDKPITAIQKACQSVSRRCLLCLIEHGNLWGKEMSSKQLVLVSRETRTMQQFFWKHPRWRKGR